MRIPTAPLVPVIRERIAEAEISQAALASAAKLKLDTLEKIMAGRSATVEFDVADKLLCVLGAPGLWRNDPELLPLYYEGAPVPPDMAKPLQCESPECDEWFALPDEHPNPHVFAAQHRRRYCSESCMQRHWWLENRKQADPTTLERVCEADGCEEVFELKPATNGTWKRKRFCSHRCMARMSMRARRARLKAAA